MSQRAEAEFPSENRETTWEIIMRQATGIKSGKGIFCEPNQELGIH